MISSAPRRPRRDAAVARLRTLEARSSAAARALSEIDADLIAAAQIRPPARKPPTPPRNS
jgi:hypothetical protein